MDNILKLLLGVLTISGMIAFLVPSESPIAPPVEATAPPAAAPAPAADEVFEGDDEGTEGEGDELDDDEEANEEDFQMGEPSIDGRPFGGEYAPPVDSSNPATVGNSSRNPDNSEQPDIVPVNNNGNIVL